MARNVLLLKHESSSLCIHFHACTKPTGDLMELLKMSIYYEQSKNEELFRTCQSIVDQALLEAGCLQSRIEEKNGNEKTIVITQQWESWTELNSYFGLEQFSALLGAMKMFGRSYEIQINGISS